MEGPSLDDSEDFDVFLSHHGRDKLIVRELNLLLRDRGIRPWLDEEQLVPGRSWQKELQKILRTIPTSAVLVGSDGIGPWQEKEMELSLSESVRRGLVVIPVLLPGAPKQLILPTFLSNNTWVDLHDGFNAAEMDRLVWGILGCKPAARPNS